MAMTIDRPRLQRLLSRQINPQVAICRSCKISAQFVWDFRPEQAVKTCRECGVVDVVEKKQEAA